MSEPEDQRMDRRSALKWVAAAVAVAPALHWPAFGATPNVRGTLTDPDLLKSYQPGKLWQRTLTPDELRTLAALCDLIIPREDPSPSASEVKVPDFIDEWISAPYQVQQADKSIVRDGLAWLNQESQKRFQKDFAPLTDQQKAGIADDICLVP